MNGYSSILLLVIVGTAASCASHAGPGGSGSDGPTAEEACTEEANASCEISNRCSPYSMQQSYGDLATCKAREKMACLPGLDAAGTSRSPARAQSCAEGLATLSCDTYLYAYSNHVPDGCALKPGARPDGAACGGNSQCSGTRCVFAAGAQCGVCASRAPAGANCSVNSDCQTGLLCALQDPTLNTRKCVVPAEEGQACNTALPCRGKNLGELYCVGDTGTAMGTCRKPVGLGASCGSTEAPVCDFLWVGVECDIQSSTCQPLKLAAAGQPCGTIGTSTVGCLAGGTCDITDAAANQGTCRPALADGSPCDPASTVDYCLWPAGCYDGICKIVDASACK